MDDRYDDRVIQGHRNWFADELATARLLSKDSTSDFQKLREWDVNRYEEPFPKFDSETWQRRVSKMRDFDDRRTYEQTDKQSLRGKLPSHLELTDADRRSLTERFVFIAEKFLRDVDSSKTTEFRVLGLPPALVDEMEYICRRIGISSENQPLKIENRHAHEIRKRLSVENVTDTTDMVLAGRCYTASPYGDALQDVLWHWACESSDGSVMRHDIEPDDKWKSFADTLKRNLSEWVEYFRLEFVADPPTCDSNIVRTYSVTELSTAERRENGQMLDDSKTPEAEVIGSRMPQILEVYTGAGMDDRFNRVEKILASEKSLVDKLLEVDGVLPIPGTSSRKIGKMFNVSHTAIQKTSWWKKNYKGENARRIAERTSRLKGNAASDFDADDIDGN